jgi:hypothetical protein
MATGGLRWHRWLQGVSFYAVRAIQHASSSSTPGLVSFSVDVLLVVTEWSFPTTRWSRGETSVLLYNRVQQEASRPMELQQHKDDQLVTSTHHDPPAGTAEFFVASTHK